MTKRNLRQGRMGWLAVAAAIAGAVMLPLPAGAQFFGFPDGYYGARPSRPPPPPRGFFSFPFFGPGGSSPYSSPYARPPVPTESTKAPPPTPRKPDTPQPTSTVVVIGDTMADWLAYGLEETFATDLPDMAVERKIRPTSGLVRFDPRDEQLDWSQSIKDELASEKPSAIVVMLGVNDRLPLRERAEKDKAEKDKAEKDKDKAPAAGASPQPGEKSPAAATDAQRAPPGTPFDFHTDKWAELYSRRIDEMIAALKGKGVPILWVGLPSVYGAKSTSDMSYLDELFRERAERAGIVYVDIWDGFVDESGRFTTQGPDFQGQTRRLRTYDGVHFTKAGAMKLAQYVAQDLRRVMTSHLMPVALPAPEDSAPAKGAPGPRPVAGPVLPLTASTTAPGDGNDLVGANGRAVPVNADPVATRVLDHGDPLAPAPGRADDFSWPRPGSDANGAADAQPEPSPPPPAPASKAPANPAKKADDGKDKTKPAPNPTAARPAPHAQLDGGR